MAFSCTFVATVVWDNPVKYVDPTGEDSVYATFNKKDQSMNVIFIPNGRSYDPMYGEYNFKATNKVCEPVEPTDMTMPKTGEPQNYRRQEFPNGIFKMTGTKHPKNNEYLGDRSIQTSATVEVETFTKALTGWIKNKFKQIDTGYSIHNGMNIDYPTQGCIRMDDKGIHTLADIVDKVLKTKNRNDNTGKAILEVISGE